MTDMIFEIIFSYTRLILGNSWNIGNLCARSISFEKLATIQRRTVNGQSDISVNGILIKWYSLSRESLAAVRLLAN